VTAYLSTVVSFVSAATTCKATKRAIPRQAATLTGAVVPVQLMVQSFVRSTLSLTFVLTAAKVVFNIKGRILKRGEFEATIGSPADAAKFRRLEALDKLLSVLTLIVGSVLALQAIGLDGARLSPTSAPTHTTSSVPVLVEFGERARCRGGIWEGLPTTASSRAGK
jgi:hypothetical protein